MGPSVPCDFHGPLCLRTLGACEVNGRVTAHLRPVELVVALATAEGSLHRDWLIDALFNGEAAPSSLPTLAYRARKIGLPVEYNPRQQVYTLTSDLSIDALNVLVMAENGDIAGILNSYQGPFLAPSESPFSMEMRRTLEETVCRVAIASGDPYWIYRASLLVKDPRLAVSLARHGLSGQADILRRAHLRTLGLHPANASRRRA